MNEAPSYLLKSGGLYLAGYEAGVPEWTSRRDRAAEYTLRCADLHARELLERGIDPVLEPVLAGRRAA